MLSFFGRGSAFSDSHNSAFFINGKDLIVIDCPATTFQKIKRFDFSKFDNIYVLVTHTHGDHAGGIGTFLQYLFFALNIKLTIVAPSIEVYDDLILLLTRIEGCESHWFNIITSDNLNKSWFVSAIPTFHTITLSNKCFGYALNVDKHIVIYTGDTSTLKPFQNYINKNVLLYTEISYYKSDVHLFYEDILPDLISISSNGTKVFLMHLDNEKEIAKIIQNTSIQLAPLYTE